MSYYRARAPEYDEWYFRRGRYDRGPQHRKEWFAEIASVEAAVLPGVKNKEALELACGTGLWTEKLARCAKRVTAVDASPEALALARKRVGSRVEFKQADLFAWQPLQRFEVVFFSFWLSHVPENQFEHFWRTIAASLRPAGTAIFVDSLLEHSSTARDHPSVDRSGIVRRKLNDGREFQVVKIFYDPPSLQRRLEELGWRGWVRPTPKFFLYGQVGRGEDARP
jgi:2-polyprenyl-3-methyl-5-hydroxy-6-metoxy-1,4-benzoquinol methylase